MSAVIPRRMRAQRRVRVTLAAAQIPFGHRTWVGEYERRLTEEHINKYRKATR